MVLGFDLHGKTIGVIGTGKIGAVFASLMSGFGCRLLAYDPFPTKTLEPLVSYVTLEHLLHDSDIVSLHCPLTPETHHLINRRSVAQMKPGVMLINTSCGALVDTPAVIEGLKNGKIGFLGLDVYEEEGDLFFEDLSNRVIQDNVFTRLLTFLTSSSPVIRAFLPKKRWSTLPRRRLLISPHLQKVKVRYLSFQ